MTMTTEARFGGAWTVARQIEDLGGGPSGRFKGIARITPDGEGLRYDEQGLMTLGAAKLMATRVYLWRPEGPTRVRVLFEDGAAFHVFDWARPECADEHLCGEDRYAVRYTFAGDSWHAHWRVTGPAKNYVMSSRYIRLKPPESAAAGALAGAVSRAYRRGEETPDGE